MLVAAAPQSKASVSPDLLDIYSPQRINNTICVDPYKLQDQYFNVYKLTISRLSWDYLRTFTCTEIILSNFIFFLLFTWLFFSVFHFYQLCYFCLGCVTEGRGDGGTSSSFILFLRLDAFIDSASATSLLAEQPLNHIHSTLHPCHTHCEV